MTTIAGKPVSAIGYGLMGLTWTPTPPPYETSIHLLKTALTHGANFWNAGEMYGPPDANSLQLLNAYFTKYPEDADKVVLSIKGGMGPTGPDGSESGVRSSVDNCLRILDGKKEIDIFECARVDRGVAIEETMGALEGLRREGKIGGIGLSEVRAETVRRAAKVGRVDAVEVEVSLWTMEGLRDGGVVAVCGELGIPVVAYSPLGRGFLTGGIRSVDDLPEGDMRREYPRFQPGAAEANGRLVEGLRRVAERKGVTLAQIAIGWVRAQGKVFGGVPVVPIPASTKVERVVENLTVVDLSEEELREIKGILDGFTVVGGRYPDGSAALADG